MKLTAVADIFQKKAEYAAQRLKEKHGEKVDVPAERIFSGLDAFQKIMAHCDLVLLATPPGFRPQHFAAAVNAGKHVFMEKPVCVDAVGATASWKRRRKRTNAA